MTAILLWATCRAVPHGSIGVETGVEAVGKGGGTRIIESESSTWTEVAAAAAIVVGEDIGAGPALSSC